MANGGDTAKFPAWNQIEKIAGQNMFYIKKNFWGLFDVCTK